MTSYNSKIGGHHILSSLIILALQINLHNRQKSPLSADNGEAFLEHGHRIDLLTIFDYFKMEMRTGAITSATHATN